MTARDAGGIASRIFALYLAWMGFMNLGLLLEMIATQTRYLPIEGFTVFSMGFKTAIIFVGALLTWANSNRLWPNDEVLQASPTMDRKKWLGIALIIFGVHWILRSLDVVLTTLLKSTLQTSIEWPTYESSTVFQSWLSTIVSLALLVTGYALWKAKPAQLEVEE